MDHPTPDAPPPQGPPVDLSKPPVAEAPPSPSPDERHVSVLAGDPREVPAPAKSQKGLIWGVVGGCAVLVLLMIGFLGFLGWYGYRQAQERNRDTMVPGKPTSDDGGSTGKPSADSSGRGTDPAAWISTDDYPPDALDRGEEGTVAIAWEVQPNGLPLRCTVERSSGHPSLDNAACGAIMRHARYAPLPAGSVNVRRAERRVVWRLPEGGGGIGK